MKVEVFNTPPNACKHHNIKAVCTFCGGDWKTDPDMCPRCHDYKGKELICEDCESIVNDLLDKDSF